MLSLLADFLAVKVFVAHFSAHRKQSIGTTRLSALVDLV
jgi:hypothetical protein